MKFEQYPQYKKDIKQLNKSWREPLRAKLEKIMASPHSQKPLGYYSNMFTTRVRNKRLIFKIKGDTITLVCLKSRDEVYDYLRKNFK